MSKKYKSPLSPHTSSIVFSSVLHCATNSAASSTCFCSISKSNLLCCDTGRVREPECMLIAMEQVSYKRHKLLARKDSLCKFLIRTTQALVIDMHAQQSHIGLCLGRHYGIGTGRTARLCLFASFRLHYLRGNKKY